ncbi:TonB-dependent receptor [Steroidobacter agaridevorans]|uniref:TonB-dependent receptor n=1 Tax=Steroidobacter agaridevorans TaxID=2695856 RepID=UPI00137AC662|nr:TonB-dependent receptor [Steroidobacter agaridevorans]
MKRTWGALRASLLPACSLSVLAFPAAAQTTDNVNALEEVVVTAQKRTESIQDVPVTVTLVNSEFLAQKNITAVDELSRAVPSISSNNGIRGVATGGFTVSSEQAVATVLDGVVMGRTNINNLFDVQRVEVLSGPQGMLFGKNASAGVINIVTNAPDLSQFELIGSVDFGNFERERERLTVNAPIGSTAALRLSLQNNSQASPVRNLLTNTTGESESYGGRLRFLWEPSDSLSLNLIGDWEESRSNGESTYTHSVVGTPALANMLAACGIVASPRNRSVCSEGVYTNNSEHRYGASAQVDYTLPNDYVITSITAQREVTYGPSNFNGLGGDTDLLPINILSTNMPSGEDKNFSQEIRFTSPAGQTVEFVTGLFYYDNTTEADSIQAGRLGPTFAPLLDLFFYPGAVTARGYNINVDSDGWAAFGQATIHVTDKWSLIAGGRYTEEALSAVSRRADAAELASRGFVFFPAFSGTFPNVDQEVDTDNFSWRAGVQYDWTPDVMTFATVARGYKGPAVNDLAAVSDPSLVIIDEEIPTNYEVGVRANIFDRRIFASATVFHTKIEDFQTQVYVPSSPSNPTPGFANGNAPEITTQGVDIQMFGELMDGLTFNTGVIYTDAQYGDDFIVACSSYQTVTNTCPAGGTTPSVDNLANVSDWRVLVGGEYARQVGSFELFVQTDLVYETGFSMSASPDPFLVMPDRTLVGARLGVRSPDGRWGVSLWGRNLFDNYYPTRSPDPVGGFNGGGGRSYISTQTSNLYRTYGVAVEFRL